VPERAGRRPSNPSFLLVVGVVWIACGFVALIGMSAGWRLIPAIFFVGMGLLYLRGGLVALARRDRD
jgi:hypothetical protein